MSRKKKKTEEEDELSKLEAMKEKQPDASLFTDLDEAFEYITSGKAEFEFRSKVTGTGYTYQVKESEDGSIFFVSIKIEDGEKWPFKYFGIIFTEKEEGTLAFAHGKEGKARIDSDHPGAKAFAFGWRVVNEGLVHKDLEIRKTAT